MQITTITFDVGATLLTTADPEATIFVEEAARVGAHIEEPRVREQIPAMYGYYEKLYEKDDSFWSDDERATAIWYEMYEYLCKLLGIEEHAYTIARRVHKRYLDPRSWKPFDDVLPVLDELRSRGIRMGLISNWDSSLISVITGLGLNGYFDTMISSADVGLHKPMPRIFELALERLEARPAEALHVGDHIEADVFGALAVGMNAALLDRGRPSAFEGPKEPKAGQEGQPYHTIKTLAELPALL
jgi:putative hydrolase of the HAD superfamily